MSNLPETHEHEPACMYREWFPQIMYNHHQTGPAGAVMFAPPFRDPFNYNFDPLVPIGIDIVGAAMHSRLVAEGKPGVDDARKGSSYSTWWNGGLRTTAYFHNMIGLLTETIGNPTPIAIPFVPAKQLPRLEPVFPDRAAADLALPPVDRLLGDREPRGARRRVAQQGARFSTTSTRWGRTRSSAAAATAGRRRRDESLRREAARRRRTRRGGAAADVRRCVSGRRGRASAPRTTRSSVTLLRDPALRDPRGYIMPSDQPDFPTATKFVNTLIKTGITVHRATAAFTVGGKSYPAGSYVVKTAQAFRPHVLDMFEPQDHPDDIPYPGGPPTPPVRQRRLDARVSDGRQFDRVLDGFDGPFEKRQRAAEAGARQGHAAARPRCTADARGRTTRSSRSTGCWRPAKTCRR